MQLCAYRGTVWRDDAPAPALQSLLGRRDTLVVLDDGAAPGVVLGVPHHAAVGVSRIAQERAQGGRVADENAAVYALRCYTRLREAGIATRLVIAAHATDHDPNKVPGSPYCEQVLAPQAPALLLECHGAAAHRPHDLELTSGRNRRGRAVAFARALCRVLGPECLLAAQREGGNDAALILHGGEERTGTLRFPALRTFSLAEAGRRGAAALHVEAKPRYRINGRGTMALTPLGARLGDALATAVSQVFGASAVNASG